jgi:hypothetical protein
MRRHRELYLVTAKNIVFTGFYRRKVVFMNLKRKVLSKDFLLHGDRKE